MNILVTGANGQLGKCIQDQVKLLREKNNDYIYTDVIGDAGDGTEYLDLLDEEGVKEFVKSRSINVIINCAAYTNVDKAETDYEMAEAVNAKAPKYLAEAALSVGAKLIHISTDYVFNGQTFLAYTEERMTLPMTAYGKTKRMGEEVIEQSGCKYLIFRTAWLYSEYGNNFIKTMLRLFNEKDELNVVNDQIGTPTYAGNLAKFIVDLVECMTPLEGKETIPLLENGIYHFTDEGVASWYDFAYFVLCCYEKYQFKAHPDQFRTVKMNGIRTKDYGSKTKRPFFSLLDKTKLKTDFKGLYEPRNWMVSVDRVVYKLINQ